MHEKAQPVGPVDNAGSKPNLPLKFAVNEFWQVAIVRDMSVLGFL
jgi:hypothetical protein